MCPIPSNTAQNGIEDIQGACVKFLLRNYNSPGEEKNTENPIIKMLVYF